MFNKNHDLISCSMGMSLGGVFCNFQKKYGDIYKKPEIKDMFLDFIISLIKRGYLKLAYNGNYLKGSPEEQVEILRINWPDEYDPDIPEKDIDNLWWIVAAPAGAVWIYPDGTEVWT